MCPGLINYGVELLNIVIKNAFWRDVVSAVRLIRSKQPPASWSDFIKEHLWHNSNITIGGKSVYYKTWFNKGVHYINDMLDENGNFLTNNMFTETFQIRIDFLTYAGLIRAINSYLHLLHINSNTSKAEQPLLPASVKTITDANFVI